MSNKENIDKQDKMIQVLEEILTWTRFQGIQNVKAVLLGALKPGSRERVAYQLSDGRSSVEVGKACGVSGMTVTNYWRRWFTLGIAQPSKKYKGRFERTFSLEDFGIEIPSIAVTPKGKTKKEAKPEEIVSKEGETE